MKTAQIIAAVALAVGGAYSLHAGNTTLVIFFGALFVIALLAPGLLSRTSEVSLGSFRASFKERVDGIAGLSDEEKRDLKTRIDAATSLDEALDVIASFTAKRIDREE
jgi:hypothetical protein